MILNKIFEILNNGVSLDPKLKVFSHGDISEISTIRSKEPVLYFELPLNVFGSTNDKVLTYQHALWTLQHTEVGEKRTKDAMSVEYEAPLYMDNGEVQKDFAMISELDDMAEALFRTLSWYNFNIKSGNIPPLTKSIKVISIQSYTNHQSNNYTGWRVEFNFERANRNLISDCNPYPNC